MRYISRGSYGLMGTFGNSLDRVFAEDDRQRKEFERWEWTRRRSVAVQPDVIEEAQPGPRIKRGFSDDGAERIWIAGWSRSSPYMIHGIASTPTINSNNCAMVARGCELSLPVPLLWAHAEYGGSIGEVVFMERNEKGIYIRATIATHEAGQYAWKKIVLGEVSALSVGTEQSPDSYSIQATVDGVLFYDKWRIKEVSICRVGANPDCTFEIFTLLKRN